MAIDNKTRALVYYLSKIQGISIRQIAKRCNVPRATVWRISKIDLSSNQRSTKGKERRGRPRKLNARLERKLRRSIHVLRERELMVAISFNKGVVICKTYEKLDGRYFAGFIDENFESMFALADKSALHC